MKTFGGILMVLLFPVVIIAAIYLWRKSANTATTAAPAAKPQSSNAASAITQTTQQVTQTVSAISSLKNAFAGLIPSDDDYQTDGSETTLSYSQTA